MKNYRNSYMLNQDYCVNNFNLIFLNHFFHYGELHLTSVSKKSENIFVSVILTKCSCYESMNDLVFNKKFNEKLSQFLSVKSRLLCK